MVRETITKADEGKPVLDPDGAEIGRLVAVRDGYGYVEPNPGLVATLRAKLGWGDASEDAHPLDAGSVDRVTDEAVYLRGTI